MKSFWPRALVVICLFVWIGSSAGLAEARTVVRTGEYVSLGDEQEIEGSFYAVGNTVSVSGKIMGDLYAAAGSITLNGAVRDDVFFVGGTVALHASTSEDVRIIAGDVTIADAVGGSVAIIGGQVKILSTASVAGDVLVYGGNVTIEGSVGGQVLGSMEALRIDGPVAGGIDIITGQLTLGEQAEIKNDIRYQSRNEIIRAPGAVVEGDLVPVAITDPETQASATKMLAIFFLILLFTSLTFFLLGRTQLELFVAQVIVRPFQHGLTGSASLIFLPIIAAILLATILGSMIGVIIGGIFLVCLVMSLPLAAILLGTLMFKALFNRIEVSLFSVTSGVALFTGLLILPYVGMVFVVMTIFFVFGGLMLGIYRRLRFPRLR